MPAIISMRSLVERRPSYGYHVRLLLLSLASTPSGSRRVAVACYRRKSDGSNRRNPFPHHSAD